MRNYAKADIEIGGGSLYTIFSVSVDEENGAAVESTFRKSGNGISFGPVKMKITFKLKNPTTPAERNWRGLVRRRQITQLVVKYPDGTRDVVDGAFSNRSMSSELEGASETTMDFVGTAQNDEAA
jgi:hypothetical protein